MKKNCLLYLMFTIASISSYARGLDFIENVGQWDNPTRFQVNLGNGKFYLTDKGFTFNYFKPEEHISYYEKLKNLNEFENETSIQQIFNNTKVNYNKDQ